MTDMKMDITELLIQHDIPFMASPASQDICIMDPMFNYIAYNVDTDTGKWQANDGSVCGKDVAEMIALWEDEYREELRK